MRPDAMFSMQSSSKPVLGIAAMIAMERGLFDLQDEVYKYIPGFKDVQVAVLKGTNVNQTMFGLPKKINLTIFGESMGW